MEDIKAYIESGVLELYALGELSPEQRLEVEAMSLKHQEVKEELSQIEHSMEKYAGENSIEPSEDLRNKVLNSLLTNLGDDRIFKSTTTREASVVPLPPRKLQSNTIYKYLFAACLALLVVSIAALLSVYNRLQDSNTRLLALQTENQQFSHRVSLMDQEISVFRDTSFKFIKLKGTPKTPASNLTVAWNPAKKKVMIDMASMKMPANDQEHQYQLWAIVAGKPVDLGVFDAKADTAEMKEMKPIAEAQAFAVTLEPRGGSANPTMEQMMVIASL